ncbi:hypothetical protein IQ250_00975 [Pseudanabaenaceae cyanobacterium LEGE 13415]|nr:hypothetical protein [Pseudanabaenaceae cyanobacterium LEGE 13415]
MQNAASYITGFNLEITGSIVRLQQVEFAREYIVRILMARFGTVPAEVTEVLSISWDEDLMGELLEQAAIVPAIEEFHQVLIDQFRTN